MFQPLWYERTRSLKLKATSDSWGFCEHAARIKSTSRKLSEPPAPTRFPTPSDGFRAGVGSAHHRPEGLQTLRWKTVA